MEVLGGGWLVPFFKSSIRRSLAPYPGSENMGPRRASEPGAGSQSNITSQKYN